MKKLIVVLVTLLAAIVVITACSKSTTNPNHITIEELTFDIDGYREDLPTEDFKIAMQTPMKLEVKREESPTQYLAKQFPLPHNKRDALLCNVGTGFQLTSDMVREGYGIMTDMEADDVLKYNGITGYHFVGIIPPAIGFYRLTEEETELDDMLDAWHPLSWSTEVRSSPFDLTENVFLIHYNGQYFSISTPNSTEMVVRKLRTPQPPTTIEIPQFEKEVALMWIAEGSASIDWLPSAVDIHDGEAKGVHWYTATTLTNGGISVNIPSDVRGIYVRVAGTEAIWYPKTWPNWSFGWFDYYLK